MSDDLNYRRRRAGHELEPAQRATRPGAVAAHHQLAKTYLERIASIEPPRGAEHA